MYIELREHDITGGLESITVHDNIEAVLHASKVGIGAHYKVASNDLSLQQRKELCEHPAIFAVTGLGHTDEVKEFTKDDKEKLRYSLIDSDFWLARHNGWHTDSQKSFRLLGLLRVAEGHPASLLDILPYLYECVTDADRAMAEVLTFGAAKYSADNWRKCEDVARYYDAAYRHLYAMCDEIEIDPKSGLEHRAHVATNIMFIYVLETQNVNNNQQ